MANPRISKLLVLLVFKVLRIVDSKTEPAEPLEGAWFLSPRRVRVYGPDAVRRRGSAVCESIVAPVVSIVEGYSSMVRRE
jgi:hypothetical protein